jgi:DhnA family fructose-bisphosphate aldolase class Ia
LNQPSIPSGLPTPALLLAADHRARGVIAVEPYRPYLAALGQALSHCDGLLASVQPLFDLRGTGAVSPGHRLYLSLNRTGLAASTFESDDRLVTTVARAAEAGLSGVKHMTRIDRSDPASAPALELLGKVLEEARLHHLEILVEALSWRQGAMARDVDSVVFAAVVAHDMGAPLLKVPVPDCPPGPERSEAVARVVASVGVPVLFLGGPRGERSRQEVLEEVRDVMAGGGAGMALGRAIYEDPQPGEMAEAVAAVVKGPPSQRDRR